MTPADRFLLDVDTAWLVYEDQSLFSVDANKLLDRPCDTCKGEPPPFVSYGPGMVQMQCADRCIDGRHTFDIEVEVRTSQLGVEPKATYRVSIVPGMVLPIVGWTSPFPEAFITPDGDRHRVYPTGVEPDTDDTLLITLPPASAPGMWAVKLKVAT